MLAGTVYFYDSFKNIKREMDIEDFNFSQEELFKIILELNIYEVSVEGYSNNQQSEPFKSIIFSGMYL